MKPFRFPGGFLVIEAERHEELTTTPYNPCPKEEAYGDAFEEEIRVVDAHFRAFFAQRGEYGSQERYDAEIPSDWWMPDDGYWAGSRCTFADILSERLQHLSMMTEIQAELRTFPIKWMMSIGHNLMFDACGRFTDDSGEYRFWITQDSIEVYFTDEHCIAPFFKTH